MINIKDLFTVIMAGGKGERLVPLTRDRAKPAVPFGGIYRIIDFTLSNCINSGIRQVLVLTQYKSQSLERHIKRGWNFLPSTLGEYIDIMPPQMRVGPDWYKGTADAVYQNFYSIRGVGKPYCLILAGDHIYKMDYSKMFEFHLDNNADVTVAAIDVPIEEGSNYGILLIDQGRRIIGFDEKPAKPKHIPGDPKRCLASLGIYLFKAETMYDKLESDAGDPASAHDFGRNIIPSMIKDLRVFCYIFQDENKKESKYWRDVGTIDAYWEANMDLVNVSPQFNLYDRNWPIRTLHSEAPPPKFVFAQSDEEGGRRGVALDSIVSAGCIISGGRVEASVLGTDVRINSFSYVFESILFDRVNIARHCRIRRAIIDKGVTVPEGTVIGYDPEDDKRRFHYISPGGIVVIPKGEILPVPAVKVNTSTPD
jgi:glucose-1-phosphate adenylyltransferase